MRPQILAAASVLIAHPDLGGLDPRGAVVGTEHIGRQLLAHIESEAVA